jgi:hypothetical protein
VQYISFYQSFIKYKDLNSFIQLLSYFLELHSAFFA